VISSYGVLISVSIVICVLVAKDLRNGDGDFVWELAPWAIISGLIGARIYHVVSSINNYINTPLSIFYVWNGGLGIWGAIAGGLIGIIICLKKSGKAVWPWLDSFAVVLPLGQAIGRWGNYFNQEIYGQQTALPWGIYINGEKHHPLFLYESLLNLLNFITLYFLFRKTTMKNRGGFFTSLYLLNYSAIRFFMEFMRQDSWKLGGLNVSILIPILLFMAALFCLIKINRRGV
jgi:prolipoprotein diacylglyceryl transferase